MFNIACGSSTTLLQAVDAIAKETGTRIAPIHAPPRTGDIRHSLANIDKAKTRLGYTGAVSFAEGIARTVAWYRKRACGWALLSMTSFGRADAPLGGRRLVAELRSVNHRFLELKLRLGREDGELEAELGKLVRSRLERGAVSLSLREETDQTESATGESTNIDEARADAWMKSLSALSRHLGTNETPSLRSSARSRVCCARARSRPRAAAFVDAARAATTAALAAMLEARAREGKALWGSISATDSRR